MAAGTTTPYGGGNPVNASTVNFTSADGRPLEPVWFSHRETAREADVSANAVGDVASGKGLAVTLAPPILSDGEEFLPEPIRCPVCRARISAVPCRACGARRGAGKAGLRWTAG